MILCLVILVALLIGAFPKVYEIYEERRLFIDNQFEMYDDWSSRPLVQQQRFYFYNISNSGELSDTLVHVEEIGPFVYSTIERDERFGTTRNYTKDLRYLNFQDMKFVPHSSVAHESSVIYTFNVPLIRNLYGVESVFGASVMGLRRKDVLFKTTVRDVLREIIDGYSVNIPPVLSRGEAAWISEQNETTKTDYEDEYYSLENNPEVYFENQFCVELFSIFRIISAPVYKNGWASTVFERAPCKCIKIFPNGTEVIRKTFPKRFNLLTKRYSIQWMDHICSGLPVSTPTSKLGDAPANNYLFSTSSHIYFDDKPYLRYKNRLKAESFMGESHINVEPLSEIITDMAFRYQFNIHINVKRDDATYAEASTEVYPMLLTEINGKSKDQIDYSIYHYVVFPRLFARYILPKIIFFTVCILLTAAVSTFLLLMSSSRDEVGEGTPLIRQRAQIHV